LEDVLFDEAEEVDEGVVPGDAIKREDEGEEPEEEFDAEDLYYGLLVRMLEWEPGGERPDREGYQQADDYARGNGHGGLLVVLRGEYLGVLQRSMGCRQLLA
jgi:hypothetical protein